MNRLLEIDPECPKYSDDLQEQVQGERRLLTFPADWLLRLRHNPFSHCVEMRVREWVGTQELDP